MIKSIEKDKNGNVTFESHIDGYWERNYYVNDNLVKSECHYSNGTVEVEQFNIINKDAE